MLYFDMFDLGMEIMLNYITSLFVIVSYFSVRHSYVISFFLHLRFLMTLELRYILVRSNYVPKLRYKTIKWRKNT